MGCDESSAEWAGGQRVSTVLDGTPLAETSGVGVGQVRVQRASGTLQCSSVLVLPNLVLTARHCVQELEGRGCAARFTTPYALEAMHVRARERTTGAWASREVVAVAVGPGEETLCGNDITLLQLDAPILDVDVFRMRLHHPAVLWERASIVGFGRTRPGEPSSDMLGVSAPFYVDCVGASCGPDSDATHDFGVQYACPGDSGGPVLDARGWVVGVVSRSDEGCGASISTSVAGRDAWMMSAASEAAAALAADEIAVPPWYDEALRGAWGDWDDDGVDDAVDNCVRIVSPLMDDGARCDDGIEPPASVVGPSVDGCAMGQRSAGGAWLFGVFSVVFLVCARRRVERGHDRCAERRGPPRGFRSGRAS